MHVTSRRPWWWSRTKAFVSSWNLTLFSCKFFVKNSFFDIQHCRLVTWLQTRTGDQGCRSGESRDRRHMWVELVVGSLLCSGSPSPLKPTFPNSNSTRNQEDVVPLCGCPTSNLLFIYLTANSRGRGRGVLGFIFAGYVPLASLSPYPIIVYSEASYTPHLSHFWTNV